MQIGDDKKNYRYKIKPPVIVAVWPGVGLLRGEAAGNRWIYDVD